jgi:hypothetical protein
MHVYTAFWPGRQKPVTLSLTAYKDPVYIRVKEHRLLRQDLQLLYKVFMCRWVASYTCSSPQTAAG